MESTENANEVRIPQYYKKIVCYFLQNCQIPSSVPKINGIYQEDFGLTILLAGYVCNAYFSLLMYTD